MIKIFINKCLFMWRYGFQTHTKKLFKALWGAIIMSVWYIDTSKLCVSLYASLKGRVHHFGKFMRWGAFPFNYQRLLFWDSRSRDESRSVNHMKVKVTRTPEKFIRYTTTPRCSRGKVVTCMVTLQSNNNVELSHITTNLAADPDNKNRHWWLKGLCVMAIDKFAKKILNNSP